MPLGMEIGLVSAQVMLCSIGTWLPPEKGHTHSHPIFGSCLLWPNGWMDEGATWCGSRPRQRPRGPSCPRKWHGRPPSPTLFSPMSIVQKKQIKTNYSCQLLHQTQGKRYKQLSLHSECIATRISTSHIAQCGNAFSIKNMFKDIKYFFSHNVFRLWL